MVSHTLWSSGAGATLRHNEPLGGANSEPARAGQDRPRGALDGPRWYVRASICQE